MNEETVAVTPGYQTTEFWIALASAIIPNTITILALFKLVPADVASTLSTSLIAVVSGIITVIVALKYIKSRTEVKIRAIDDKISRMDRAFNLNVQNTEEYYKKANLYMNLIDKGIINQNQLKKELNIA